MTPAKSLPQPSPQAPTATSNHLAALGVLREQMKAKQPPTEPAQQGPKARAGYVEPPHGQAAIHRTDRSDPSVGTQHIARIGGDPREFPLSRADSTMGMGAVWGPGSGSAWDEYSMGPSPSQNGYISPYLGDTKEEALRKLPQYVREMDASPHYKKKK